MTHHEFLTSHTNDAVARLTTVGAEYSRELRREVEKAAREVAGKVAAQEVKKALAARAAAGGPESARVRAEGEAARGEGQQDGSTADEEGGARAEREARPQAREGAHEPGRREGRWEMGDGLGETEKEALHDWHARKERKHVVRAVPVQTAVAVAEAVAAEGGGHPALRATATPLVMARALQDKEKGVAVSKQALHEQEQGGKNGGAGGGDDRRGGGAGAGGSRRAETQRHQHAPQEALRRERRALHTRREQTLARNRKVAAEGAEMLPRGDGAREGGAREGELRRQAGDEGDASRGGWAGSEEGAAAVTRAARAVEAVSG